jgi:hypothetical protein
MVIEGIALIQTHSGSLDWNAHLKVVTSDW